MIKNKYAIPNYATADDIKRIRFKLGMSQKEFAELMGISKPTIERWESGKTEITGPIVLLMKIIDNNPEYIEKLEIPKKAYRTRLYYMKNQILSRFVQ